MSAANLFISYLWDWVDIVSKCIVGLFWGRQWVFYWLLWGCAGNWIKVRAPKQSHNACHDNSGLFSKRPITGLAWLLIYHNLFYLPVLRQICRFRPTSLHTARKLHPEQKQTKNHRLGTDSLSLLTNKFPWNNLQVKVSYLKFWMFFSKFKSLKIDRKVSQQKKRNRRWRTLRFALVRFQQRRLSL